MRLQPFLLALAPFCLTLAPALAADDAAAPKPATSPATPTGKNLYPIGTPKMTESCGQPLPHVFAGVLPTTAAPVTEVSGVKLPTLISSSPALLPEAARKANFKGTAQVLAVVCKDGTVGFVQPMRSESREIGEAAQEAVSKWKFHPATKEGTPVAVKLSLRVDFTPGS